MAIIAESETYEPTIYELEIADPVAGGPAGKSNKAAQQLANRTNWLNANKVGNGDGSAAAPGMAFKSQPALGLFRPTAGVLAFSDGVERGRIAGGVLAWGTTNTAGANPGDVVLGSSKALRSTGGNNLIGHTSSLGGGGVAVQLASVLNVTAVGTPSHMGGAGGGEAVLANEKGLRSANGAGTTTVELIKMRSDNYPQLGVGRVAAVAAGAFSATHYFRMHDMTGNVLYVPAMAAGW